MELKLPPGTRVRIDGGLLAWPLAGSIPSEFVWEEFDAEAYVLSIDVRYPAEVGRLLPQCRWVSSQALGHGAGWSPVVLLPNGVTELARLVDDWRNILERCEVHLEGAVQPILATDGEVLAQAVNATAASSARMSWAVTPSHTAIKTLVRFLRDRPDYPKAPPFQDLASLLHPYFSRATKAGLRYFEEWIRGPRNVDDVPPAIAKLSRLPPKTRLIKFTDDVAAIAGVPLEALTNHARNTIELCWPKTFETYKWLCEMPTEHLLVLLDAAAEQKIEMLRDARLAGAEGRVLAGHA